jgi:hypothetical protein
MAAMTIQLFVIFSLLGFAVASAFAVSVLALARRPRQLLPSVVLVLSGLAMVRFVVFLRPALGYCAALALLGVALWALARRPL